MRYKVNEKVTVLLTVGKVDATIIGVEYFFRYQNKHFQEQTRYQVTLINGTSLWIDELYVSKDGVVTLNYEKEINKLLIDACLDTKRFDMIPGLLDQEGDTDGHK